MEDRESCQSTRYAGGHLVSVHTEHLRRRDARRGRWTKVDRNDIVLDERRDELEEDVDVRRRAGLGVSTEVERPVQQSSDGRRVGGRVVLDVIQGHVSDIIAVVVLNSPDLLIQGRVHLDGRSEPRAHAAGAPDRVLEVGSES